MNRLSIYLIALLSMSCENPHFTRLSGKTMGTYYDIQYKSGIDYFTEIDSILHSLIAAASTYDSASEISRLNRLGTIKPTSPYLPRLLTKAKFINLETRGSFEPTLMPLIRAHGFSTSKRVGLSRHDIDSLLSYVSLNYIQFDSTTIHTTKPGVELDLSAIGEGFAIDLVSNFLAQKGITDYKVEIGGEMKCKGQNPKNELWRVGIEMPDGSGKLFTTTILQNESISTSGISRKYIIDENGIRQSHIIDPRTGFSIDNNLLSVTIKHDEATLADGFATSLMVMGLDSAKGFAISHHYKVLMIYNENGKVLSWSSPNFFNTQDRTITLR
jgi:FAD:protein FMN transferase